MTSSAHRFDAANLPQLFAALQRQGYEVIGPTVQEGAIVYDRLTGPAELPQGWRDEQAGGRYRLHATSSPRYFDFASSPHSWKAWLHPARQKLFTARQQPPGATTAETTMTIEPHPVEPVRQAFLGVRSCDLHAVGILDRVFTGHPANDEAYQARRDAALIIVVQCSVPAATCFCTSMGTGPAAEAGFDLALTEIVDATGHWFLCEVATAAGEAVIGEFEARRATAAEAAAARAVQAATAEQIERTKPFETAGVKELLARNLESPQWAEVAERCLACTNCTMVCPTCFCTTVEDVTDLRGATSERWRRWDSCFTADFTYLHGVGSVRPTTESRYRQWLTHKLSTWFDQFGEAGCVGCGRCITWCPVGIDLTEEVAAIRRREQEQEQASSPPEPPS